MQYKKICFNGLATFGFLSLMFLLYSLNGGGDTFIIQRMSLLSSSASSSLSSSSNAPLNQPSSSLSTSSNTSTSSSSVSKLIARLISSPSSSPSSKGPEKRQLLLVTKGRSGSSFTSALVRNDDQVFYTFEPLFILQKLTEQERADTDALRQKAYAVLQAFLECDFSAVTGRDLDNFQIRLSSPLASHFLQCIRAKDVGPTHLDCLFQMMRECNKKPVTFAKVIRLPMQWAEPILKRLPNLKILYLIRDPRAVLNSQARVFRNFKWPEEVDQQSKVHCASVEEDLVEIERLREIFPGRFHVIKYERGATEPMEYAQEIYAFSGLNFTQNTTDYINSLKDESPKLKPYQKAYSLHRSNGTQTMNSWRYKAGYNAIKQVDQNCATVYQKIGYRAVTSQSDLESDRPLVDLNVSFNKLPPAR